MTRVLHVAATFETNVVEHGHDTVLESLDLLVFRQVVHDALDCGLSLLQLDTEYVLEEARAERLQLVQIEL